mmetsp:Transcript_3487/g.4804  ORF Transcript_3487/g.4804 Transcript_3487/m.4804 type:complete len:191 (-) Transcript_3487:432-1004(-)
MNKTIQITILLALLCSIECGYFITSVGSSCASTWWWIYETTSCHWLGDAYYKYDCGSEIIKYACKDDNCENCVTSATFTADQCIYGIEFSCTSSDTLKVPTGYVGELSYNGTAGCDNQPYWANIFPKNTCINESPYLSQEYKCNGAEVDFYTCKQQGCPTTNTQSCTKTVLKVGCYAGNSTSVWEQVECN